MDRLRCECCGKFIAEKDIPNCKQEEKWSWDKIELIDVWYYCLKCTEKEKGNESNPK